MANDFNLGLRLSIEKEKERALQYLNKATMLKYEKLLFELIECAYDIQNSRRVEKEHLELLEIGMQQPLEIIFDTYSGNFLAKLSHFIPEAKLIFIDLSKNKSSQIRYNAVTLLLCEPDDTIIEQVINMCINDPSRKVRQKVADVCQRLDYKKSVELLKHQYDIEFDESVKKSLIFSIKLLSDGYILEAGTRSDYDLLVKTSGGGLKGISLSKDDLKVCPIDDIVIMVRENRKLPF